jgi:Helitron helicase-like domain at N-terminus
MSSNITPEGSSLHDINDEDGISEGDCAYPVHGLTGQKLDTMTTNKIKALALQHLNKEGNFLIVGHSDKSEPAWDNPQLYPKMFPWLFPYGLGGIGSVSNLSDKECKRHLLMYHDKRFQTDVNFPFIAFSHEQMKASTTQSFLLAEKNKFQAITDRLLNLDQHVLNSLIEKMTGGEHVVPVTDEEKCCFQVIKDLDHVAGNVKGSITSKKYMQNEIWSLVTRYGTPLWYITLSPADVKHPICLYYAGSNSKFEPTIMNESECIQNVCRNPVANARFFNAMVQMFIEEVLGMGSNRCGLYGDTQAYYGTVEQQGRLTLHIHLLLWIKGSITPKEM